MMMTNLPEWNEERAKLIFDAIPEANWVACDYDGLSYWFDNRPTKKKSRFTLSDCQCGYIGKFHCPDWTKSLYGRRWVPKINEKVYFVVLSSADGVESCTWQNNEWMKIMFARNLVFRTEEEAEARFEELMEVGK